MSGFLRGLNLLFPGHTRRGQWLRRLYYIWRVQRARSLARRKPPTSRSVSKGPQTVMIVDSRVPHFDLSAGDRNVQQSLETIISLGRRVIFVSDEAHASPYDAGLRALGAELCLGYAQARRYLKNNQAPDTVILNRPHIARRYLPLARRYGCGRVIYCCHDLHFWRLTRERAVLHLPPDPCLAYFEREELALADAADLVLTVSSAELAFLSKTLKSASSRLAPIFMYHDFPALESDFQQKEHLLFVGGARHDPNVDGLAWFCQRILPRIRQALPDIALHVAGEDYQGRWAALDGPGIRIHGQVSDAELRELYRNCRLCVAPLRYGAGVKGKLVEAMYHGAPVISTSIGLEGLLNQTLTGYDTEELFAENLIRLYGDPRQLRTMAVENQAFVRARFSLAEARKFYDEIL